MLMSVNEIVTSYKLSKHKKEQIKILSDLNCCSKDEILSVISANIDKIKTHYAQLKDMNKTELTEIIIQEREAYQVLEQIIIKLQKELKGE